NEKSMSLLPVEKDRRVIPRWRDFRTTVETGELAGKPTEGRPELDSHGYLELKVARWQHENSAETAADLVTSALVLGRHAEAADAARDLLRAECEVMRAVKAVAELILVPEDQAGRVVTAELKDIDIEADVLRLRVRALRARLRDEPRNALVWVDLS